MPKCEIHKSTTEPRCEADATGVLLWEDPEYAEGVRSNFLCQYHRDVLRQTLRRYDRIIVTDRSF